MTKPFFRRILVPIDGSQVSKKAAEYAIHLAEIEGAELVVIHVIEDIKQGGAIGLQARYGNLKIIEGFRKARETSAEQWISGIKEPAQAKGIRIKAEILDDRGNSEAGAIVNYAEKNNVDLIVIGSKGYSRFKRLMVGSVANSVFHLAMCPVMVIR